MTIDVLIADDQEMVRTGLRHLINADPDLKVIAEADNGKTALRMARRLKPDVCLLDIRMPEMTGLEVTQQLATDPDPPKIVIVTTFDLEEYLLSALQAGASGFVLKDAPAVMFTTAVHAAANGESLISPQLTNRLIQAYVAHHPGRKDALDAFTPREIDVLRAVCSGETNDRIARELDIASSTVKGYIASLMHKTDVENRVKLVIWAYRHTDLTP